MRNYDTESEESKRSAIDNAIAVKVANHMHDTVRLETLCTKCQQPILLEWPSQITFAGKHVTAREYLSKALRSTSVFVVCDKCLDEMPDVNLEDVKIGHRI